LAIQRLNGQKKGKNHGISVRDAQMGRERRGEKPEKARIAWPSGCTRAGLLLCFYKCGHIIQIKTIFGPEPEMEDVYDNE